MDGKKQLDRDTGVWTSKQFLGGKMMMTIIDFLNAIWGSGLEAIIGCLSLIVVTPAIWWYFLPRYTAICCHDGKDWLDVKGVWSAARGVAASDLEQFTKQWLGQALTGKFITGKQARVPVNPVPRRHHVVFWGPKRGIYYVVGVRIFDADLLEKFSGRLECAPVKFEEADECLPFEIIF